MEIIITQWALDAYLNLTAQQAFTKEEYRKEIRPDVLLLKTYPNNIKFKQPKFWSIAQEESGESISKGFKMKWHQLGSGNNQLRLPVGLIGGAFLCEAYIKENPKQERRKLAKFKTHLQLIKENKFMNCGRLS